MTKSLWLVGGVGVVTVLVIIGAVIFFDKNTHRQSVTQNHETSQKQQSTDNVPQSLSTSMLYLGEVFWGRGIEYYAKRSQLGYAYPFSGLTSVDKAGFDAWIGDMECPITSKDIPYQVQVDSLLFNCRPEYTPEAAKWFTALTLANNHTDNNGGEWGIEQTRTNLATAGIQYFGDYNMAHTSNICDVIAMPAKLNTSTGSTKSSTVPIALCGYDYVGNVQPKQQEFDVIQSYTKYMPVVAMPHMGVEYRSTAEEAKVQTYHKLIDSGADVVIGAHPHVVQNSENYKGRLIVYSTGNFMFDQQSLGKDTILSLGVALKLTIKDEAAITAYASLNNCQRAHDDCLNQLSTKLANRPKIDVAYDSRCFEQSSTIPKKASQVICDDILTRAIWSAATAELAKEW